jgi:hypothetical protein
MQDRFSLTVNPSVVDLVDVRNEYVMKSQVEFVAELSDIPKDVTEFETKIVDVFLSRDTFTVTDDLLDPLDSLTGLTCQPKASVDKTKSIHTIRGDFLDPVLVSV